MRLRHSDFQSVSWSLSNTELFLYRRTEIGGLSSSASRILSSYARMRHIT